MLETEFCLLYKTLSDKDKRRVRALIIGMTLAKKNADELTNKEKRFVRFSAQAIRMLRKKTAELELEAVNSKMV